MIEVESLYKSYRRHAALRGISFSVNKGVVGFLGPNGAGKSTTMKILAGCLAATSGSVRIHGHDILTESRAARRHIGFMPETTPLEMDMKVRDFLAFRAGIKGVTPSEIRRKVDEVSGQCEIADVLQRRIGNLSKGYRQRVGLADAMIHDPSILILDEPTAGLDPNQILSVRQLVRRIGEDHTVLLSSHILGEVESTCDHVIIINHGKILADDPIGAVKSRVGQARSLRLVTTAPRLELEKSLSTLPWTESIQTGENGSGRLEAFISLKADIPENELESLAPEVARRVISGGWDLHELTTRERTLEEIFASLTRHHPSPSNC